MKRTIRRTDNYKTLFEKIVAEVLPYGEIDGATILTLSKNGLRCMPGRQLIPLRLESISDLDKEDANLFPVPLDFNRFLLKNLEGIESMGIPNDVAPLTRDQESILLKGIADFDFRLKLSEGTQKNIAKLDFLQSSGTRHHSLWGITVTSSEPLIAITISEDGDVRIFYEGRNLLTQEDN